MHIYSEKVAALGLSPVGLSSLLTATTWMWMENFRTARPMLRTTEWGGCWQCSCTA